VKKVIIPSIMLAIAVLFFAAGSWYGKVPAPTSTTQSERTILYYVDPMNPGFRSETPGVAPCGMPLEPVYAESGDGHDYASPSSLSPGAVQIKPARQQLIGVNIAPVEIRPMTYTLRLYGRVSLDETRIYRVNASTDSWIRELSDVTTGSIIKKNKILAVALAPAYYNAQVTYLVALDNIDRIKQQLGGELRHQQTDMADNQIRAAVQALQNLGISDAQIGELANTRKAQPYLQVRSPASGVVLSRNLTLNQWFKAGDEFFSIADIGKVWVYADVYENEARYLKPGMAVKVSHGQLRKIFDAQVCEVLPLFDAISKTLKVRLDIENPDYELRPDMFVDVEIPVTMPASMYVTADAVIDSGTRTVVYVDTGEGTFEPRRVETGWRLGRQVQITAGLMPGDKVVVAGNFLIDSESRMKTAASGTDDKRCKDPVCGMYADEAQAENSGRTAQHAGKTYYFCSDYCVQIFTESPGKYVADEQTPGLATMPELENGWLGLLKPVKASPGMKHGKSEPATETKDTPRKSASTGVVIDWNGETSDHNGSTDRDWGAWGKFPGAKYLGLHDNKKMLSERQQNMPAAGSDTSTEEEQSSPAVDPPLPNALDTETGDSMHEQPSSDQMPAPSK
jgi:RND family efflux transporter MFP subunit